MAIKFLNGIDLGQNEIQNGVVHNLPTASLPSGVKGQLVYDTTSNLLKFHDGTSWITLSAASASVQSVGVGAGIVNTGTSTDPIIEHSNTSSAANLTSSSRTYVDSLSFDTFGHVTGYTTAAETVVNTDTNDIDYINSATFIGGTLSLSGVGNAGASISLDGRYLTAETDTLDDVVQRGGSTAGTIEVGGLTVNGDLTVSGAYTVKLAEEVQIEDSLLVLNSNETALPSQDAGIIVERGIDPNVGFIWDESTGQFALISTSETGSTVGNVTISDYEDLHIGGLLTDDAATIGGSLILNNVINAGTDTDKFLVLDATGNVDFRTGSELLSDIGGQSSLSSATESNEGIVFLASTSEATAGTNTTKAVTPAGLQAHTDALSHVAIIDGDALTTSFQISHGLDSFDVIVQVVEYGNSGTGATYETVYTDVKRNTLNTVRVEFSVAVPNNQSYKVLIYRAN